MALVAGPAFGGLAPDDRIAVVSRGISGYPLRLDAVDFAIFDLVETIAIAARRLRWDSSQASGLRGKG